MYRAIFPLFYYFFLRHRRNQQYYLNFGNFHILVVVLFCWIFLLLQYSFKALRWYHLEGFPVVRYLVWKYDRWYPYYKLFCFGSQFVDFVDRFPITCVADDKFLIFISGLEILKKFYVWGRLHFSLLGIQIRYAFRIFDISSTPFCNERILPGDLSSG